MPKIIKNNTASPVSIDDVGVVVPASGQLLIDAGEYLLYSRSNDIVTLIGDSTVTINNGDIDLDEAEGIRLIQGNFPEIVSKAGPSTPKITNLTLTNADTEYSHTFEDNVKRITIKSRTHKILKYAWVATESGTNYLTLKGHILDLGDVSFYGKTIYIQSPSAGSVVEIEELYG